jgi:hypothetical protein
LTETEGVTCIWLTYRALLSTRQLSGCSKVISGQSFPNFKEVFFLHTDASVIGLGVILGQYDEKGKERVIAYASRKCDDHGMNYSPTDLEALAVLWGIDYFDHYLKGANGGVIINRPIEVFGGPRACIFPSHPMLTLRDSF